MGENLEEDFDHHGDHDHEHDGEPNNNNKNPLISHTITTAAAAATTTTSTTTEEVARVVIANAAAVRPKPSIVFSLNNNRSNSKNNNANGTFEKLSRHIAKMWKHQGFSKENSRKGFFNPEHLTSQKRQWTQLQMQMLERKKWTEPSCLFEHMVVIGIHPEAETQALETALLKRRTWERELDAPERLRDVMRQQFRGVTPAFPDPEILFSFPPGKRLPMRQKDLFAFCFPGGVEAHLVERTPSLSELNEIIYGQDHVMRDDLSYIFLLKVADNATLYGVCIYVPELVKKPPGIMRRNANTEDIHVRKPLGRFSLTTYRCYCFLTKLPFFDLHFEVLNSIITQERLDRITEHVNEMTVGELEEGERGVLEMNDALSLNLQKSSDKIELSMDLSSSEETSNIDIYQEKASLSVEEEKRNFLLQNGLSSNGSDMLQGNSLESVSGVISDPSAVKGANCEKMQENSNGEVEVFLNSLQNKQATLSCYESAEDSESSSIMEGRLQRVESLESISSYRQSVNSEDDDGEVSTSGQEYNISSSSEVGNCLLQILYEYYKLPVPARGSSLSFQPLEHLPPLNFTRSVDESSTLLGGRTVHLKQCRSVLEMVEVQHTLATAEEAAAISIWTVATICRVLSLENVLSLFACVLLEKQIVVVCPNVGVLSAVVLSVIPLIRPFQWQSLMLPILPNQMLDFLDAPVPFIVGMLQKSPALRAKSSSVVVVNVQRDKVSMPYTPPLPHQRELSSALEPYHAELAANADYSKKHPVYVCNADQSCAAESFLAVIRSYLESLCKNLRSHTITNVQSNNDKVSLLLKDSFVEDFERKDHSFMKLFVDTQLFSMHTDAVLSFIESN